MNEQANEERFEGSADEVENAPEKPSGNIPGVEPDLMDPTPVPLPADEPPKSGEWVDLHDEPLTEEEMEKGRILGEDTDIEDDDDNGGFE
jgi:hypothetical protein